MGKPRSPRAESRGARALLVLLVLGVSLPARAEDLLVFAAASTTEAMQEASTAYTAAKSGVHVQFSFGSSTSLARQIAAGAPVDVFVSADNASVDSLQQAGLVAAQGRKNVLTNRLVVVVPRESRLQISSAHDLQQVKKLSLGDPAGVPAGRYAKSWLEQKGEWSALASRVVPSLDVRAALAAVESGAVDAAIVYQTDALITQRVKVAYRVPLAETPAIRYPVALLARSGQKPNAAGFFEFLSSDKAKSIFTRRGFVLLDER